MPTRSSTPSRSSILIECECGYAAIGHDDLVVGSMAVCPACGRVVSVAHTAELEQPEVRPVPDGAAAPAMRGRPDLVPPARSRGMLAARDGTRVPPSVARGGTDAEGHPVPLVRRRPQDALRYAGVLPDVLVLGGTDGGPGSPLFSARFSIGGQELMAINGGPTYRLTEAFSIMVLCDDQAEVDRYWDHLTDGGAEQPRGWLKDRFGVSWQIVAPPPPGPPRRPGPGARRAGPRRDAPHEPHLHRRPEAAAGTPAA